MPAFEPGRATRLSFALVLLSSQTAFASQGPGVGDGTAEPTTRATAAAMVLLPIVAILVFAAAKALGFTANDES